MKILHVINSYSPIKGAGPADRCQKMSKYLADKGHSVTVVTADYGLLPEFIDYSSNVEVISFKNYLGRFCYTPSIKKYLKNNIKNFDVIHLMNHWTYQNIIAYEESVKNKIPYIFSAMGAIPIVYRSFFIKKMYNNFYGYNIIKNANILMAITKMECKQYESYNFVNKNKIFYLPNAIDRKEYFIDVPKGVFRKKINIEDNKKIILYLGRIAPIKGPDILLEGFIKMHNEIPNSILVYVGPDYDMKTKMEKKVKEANLENKVKFVEPLTGILKLSAYNDADVFVVPSRQENMSIVALEAATFSKPIVITDACDFNEIEKYGAGKVVSVDSYSIMDAVKTILNDKNLKESMGVKARKMVEDYFIWEKLGEKYEQLLENILK